MMTWTVTSQPLYEPITLSQAKAWLRVDGNEENALIATLIITAREMVETDTGLILVPRTIRIFSTPPTTRELELPVSPVASVDDVTYIDGDGATQTYAATNYELLSGRYQSLKLKSDATWPAMSDRRDALRIDVTAGTDDRSQWSNVALQAMQMLIGHWFANREAVITGTVSREVELSYRALVHRALWQGV